MDQKQTDSRLSVKSHIVSSWSKCTQVQAVPSLTLPNCGVRYTSNISCHQVGISDKEISFTDVGIQGGCKISVTRNKMVEKEVAAGNTNMTA